MTGCQIKKGLSISRINLTPHFPCLLVPEVGIEPTREQVSLDFESSASTSFTTPAFKLIYNYTENFKMMSIWYWHTIPLFVIFFKKRGCSSDGRAHDWQSWGRRFDPDQLHQKIEGQLRRLPLFAFAFSLAFRQCFCVLERWNIRIMRDSNEELRTRNNVIYCLLISDLQLLVFTLIPCNQFYY